MFRYRPSLTLTTLAAVAGLALGAGPAPASTSTVRVAVANQNPSMFAAANWQKLKFKRTRHVVKWNAIDSPAQLAAIDAFVDAARAHGVSVLLHVSTDDFTIGRGTLPSAATYRRKVGKLVARYYPRGVRDWGVWNEANDRTQPTYKNPARAADYFRQLWSLLATSRRCGKRVTSKCQVVALDLLDGATRKQQAATRSYIQRFYRRLNRTWDRRARTVGLHNYSDTNRHKRTGTKNVITQVKRYTRKPRIWMTETGGVLKIGTTGDFRCNPNSAASVRKAESRAGSAIAWMFRLAQDYRRDIDRVYVYQWTGTDCSDAVRFDSGLTRADGSVRPGYTRVRNTVRASKLFKP